MCGFAAAAAVVFVDSMENYSDDIQSDDWKILSDFVK